MSSQPFAVTVTRSPSRTSTVVVADSKIAGPLTSCLTRQRVHPEHGDLDPVAEPDTTARGRPRQSARSAAPAPAGSTGSAPTTATRALTMTTSWPGAL